MTEIFMSYFNAPRENLEGEVVLLKVRLSEPEVLLTAASAPPQLPP